MNNVDQLLNLAAELLRVSRDQEVADQLTVAKGFGELAKLYPDTEMYRTKQQIALEHLSWCLHERGLLRLVYPPRQDLHIPEQRLLRSVDSPSDLTAADRKHLCDCHRCSQLLRIFARESHGSEVEYRQVGNRT